MLITVQTFVHMLKVNVYLPSLHFGCLRTTFRGGGAERKYAISLAKLVERQCCIHE